jgi:hypothetical protein
MANLTPDPLRKIQPRLAAGEMIQMQPQAGLSKEVHRNGFMPADPFHMEPHLMTENRLIQMSQTPKKSFPIGLSASHHRYFPQQGSYSSEQIQSLPMLTGGGNSQLLCPLGPSDPQPRMEEKAYLLLPNTIVSLAFRDRSFS